MVISTNEAARRLRVTPQRVLAMLHDELLTGRQVGRTWLVDEASVAARASLPASAGRPWTTATVHRVIDALSDGRKLSQRDTALVRRTDAGELAVKVGQAITVRRYATKWRERVDAHLILTGESALDRITAEPGRNLHATVRGIHGYVHNADAFNTLATTARLVEDSTGDVFIYRIRDDLFPWTEAPIALVAADCVRSASTRVRSAGLEALQQMREQWLTNTA